MSPAVTSQCSSAVSLCPGHDTPAVLPTKLILDDPEKIKRDPPSFQLSVTSRFIDFDQIILVVAVCGQRQTLESNVK